MSNINMNKAMLEMQRMASQAQLQPTLNINSVSDENNPKDFSVLLKTAIENVNEVQQTSGKLKKAYEMGDPSVDLPQVMMAGQKATIAFQAMLQVRNNLMQAYKDVMSMPV